MKKSTFSQFLCAIKYCFVLLLVTGTSTLYATTWTTVSAGSINVLTNWTNGTTSPTTFATPGDTWIVTHNMTLSAGAVWTVGTPSAAAVTVHLQTGGNVLSSGAATINVNIHGHMIVGAGASYLTNYSSGEHRINIAGNLTMSGGVLKQQNGGPFSINIGGNLMMNGGSMGKTNSGTGITSFILDVLGNATLNADTLYLRNSTTNIHGLFTMAGGVVSDASGTMSLNMHDDFLLNGGVMALRANDTIKVTGDYVMGGGKIDYNYGDYLGIKVNGSATINSDTILMYANTFKLQIDVDGNYTQNGGGITLNGNTMTLDMNVQGNYTTTGGIILLDGNGVTLGMNVQGNYTTTGGITQLDGNGVTLGMTVQGNCNTAGGMIILDGTSVNSVMDMHGNYNTTGGVIKIDGTIVNSVMNVQGNFDMSAGDIDIKGTHRMNIYGNYVMNGGQIGSINGGARIIKLYGNCSISGSAAFFNSTTGVNEIHIAALPPAPTQLIYNTSSGSWSRTIVYVDTSCTAVLASNFSTSTGISPTYGIVVLGTLICPASYTMPGTGSFTVNQIGSLLMAGAGGVNEHVTTTGARQLDPRAKYVYNGTVPQMTGSYLPASLTAPGQLIINNSAGVTLSQNTTTTGTLIFADGILHTGTYAITTNANPGAVTGAGAGRYVEGRLVKNIASFTSINYETGSTSYAPVFLTLSSVGTAGTIGVKCTSGVHPSLSTSGVLATNMVNQYWGISATGITGPATITPTFNYEVSEIAGGSNASFSIQKYVGAAWLGTSLNATNTSMPYTSTPTVGIPLATLVGDYVVGNTCGTPITGTTTICAPGDTTTLSNATPGGTWTSAATAVATVSASGLVTAIGAGTAVIHYATLLCTVSAVVSVGVPPIAGPGNVCVGTTISLTNTISGGTWSSSSPSLGTVSASGVVTGVAAGTALISYVAGGCPPVTHTVTVAPLAPITGVPNVFVGNTIALSCAVAGGTWSSGNPVVASVSATGVVTGNAIGSATISYSVGTCAATYTVNVDYNYLILNDSIVNPTDTTCNTPKFYVRVNGVSPLLRIKTYYGDGSKDSVGMLGAGVFSNIFKAHTYGSAGNYTVKHVVYHNNIPVDSVTFTYNHSGCNNLRVKLYFDANNDCVKNAGEPFNISPMVIRVDSAGVPVSTFSALAGINYKAYGPAGTVYSFHLLPSTLYYGSCPVSATVTFTISAGAGSYPVQLFGLGCNPVSGCDIDITSAIPVTAANVTRGNLYVRNNSCAPTDATITLKYSPLYTGIITASPTPVSAGGGVMTWYLTDLSAAAGMKTINFSAKAVAGAYLTIGSTIVQTSEAAPIIIDIDTTNNNTEDVDTVTGPYDPNMVEVYPAGCFVETDTQFRYTIHFENMGNDTAHNIYIMDTLSEFVDLTRLRLVVSSADMIYSIVENSTYKVVRFDFPDIKLPDTSHHGLSDGSVTFDIPVTAGLPNGAVVTNRAGIYFDYADVVMTNTTANVKGCPTTKVATITPQNRINIYPNPADNNLVVETDATIKHIAIANIVGQTVYAGAFDTKKAHIDIAGLVPGVYLLKVNGTEVKKFVKN